LPKIAIDLMGNENPPKKVLEALLDLPKKLEDPIELICIGDKIYHDAALSIFKEINQSPKIISCEFIVSEETIEMNDPLSAIRKKKNSSMSIGLKLIKDKQADALISCGNTAALMSLSKIHLKMLCKLTRPALLAMMPTKKTPVAVVDVGANVLAPLKQLKDFLKMGIAYLKTKNVSRPTAGILNIGVEKQKGKKELLEAYHYFEKCQDATFCFKGNIEAKEAFEGSVDLLITDGFSGNIFLKTAEGIANFIMDQLVATLSLEERQMLPFLKELKKHLHYEEYPGALLTGINGIVIKCHGYSPPHAILNAVKEASTLSKNHFIDHLIKFLK